MNATQPNALPPSGGGSQPNAPPPGTDRAPTRPPVVLVAEDEASIRPLLSLSLRRHGFSVLAAADGREAVELYRRHRGEVDLVLLDVIMPVLDGLKALAALRQINPDVRCCLMGGSVEGMSEEEVRALCVERVFAKPF